jgi:hypothetical protein
MLVRILELKNKIISDSSGSVTDIGDFISLLESSNNIIGLSLTGSAPIWKNYTHAVLISSFQILTNYDLVNWNQYFGEIDKICSIIKSDNPRESDVLELFVLHSINYVFNFGQNTLQIKAYRANDNKNPTYFTDDSNSPTVLNSDENINLLNNIKVAMKLRGLKEKKIWGDNDIVVTLNFNSIVQQFCIISCKTSLRERVYQSIFWSMHSRLEGIGKHVFVTVDKGISGKSEIGLRKPDNSANKSRDVLESTMDRVYVLRNSTDVNRSQVIKDFTFLETDLKTWAKDIAGI